MQDPNPRAHPAKRLACGSRKSSSDHAASGHWRREARSDLCRFTPQDLLEALLTRVHVPPHLVGEDLAHPAVQHGRVVESGEIPVAGRMGSEHGADPSLRPHSAVW